jgi:hypothetical protein
MSIFFEKHMADRKVGKGLQACACSEAFRLCLLGLVRIHELKLYSDLPI